MDKSLLVEIFVDTGGGEGFIGTGYPVAQNLIITARHVVYPKGETPVTIKLRWYNQSEKFRDKQELAPDCVVWDGGERFDVALIKCRQLPVPGIGYLSSEKPQTGMEWESEGFADAGFWDDVCHPTPMQGKVFSAADESDEFVLGTAFPVSNEEGWQGASGSPVFVNGKIIGIIKSCPKAFNATRFNATPIWKLREEDKRFCKLVDDEKHETRLLWARQALEKQLSNNVVLAELCRCLDQPVASAKIIASALLENPLEQILNVLLTANANLLQTEDTAAAGCIKNILHIVLPTLFADTTTASVKKPPKKDFCFSVLRLPVATKTVAEIIMAGADVRATAFKSLREGEDFPEGVYSLSEPPECGIDTQGKNYINNFHSHMIKKFTGSDVPAHVKPEDRIKLVVNKLSYWANLPSKAYTHYYLYYLPDGESERKMFTDVINTLQSAYPAVAFINLSTNVDLLINEHEQLLPLTEFLSEPNPITDQTP